MYHGTHTHDKYFNHIVPIQKIQFKLQKQGFNLVLGTQTKQLDKNLH